MELTEVVVVVVLFFRSSDWATQFLQLERGVRTESLPPAFFNRRDACAQMDDTAHAQHESVT